jgi:prepilin-type N-terminal cleavage/methylation domain-containing protein
MGPRHDQGGFTLIELLIALGVVALLVAIGLPTYLSFLQRARETALILYLSEVHKGQVAWRLETDSLSFSGDFDELEETGMIPDASNSKRVRVRAPRRGPTRTTSSRLVQNYSLALTAQDDPSTNSYTYSITASPQNGDKKARWYYLDQTGVIRTGIGKAGPYSAPAS